MLSNWLGASPLLVAKLGAGLAPFEQVQAVSSVQEAQALVRKAPSCFIAWAGDSVQGYAGSGETAAVSQRWSVILVTAPGADPGMLLSSVISALSGAVLSEAYDPLRFTGSAGAVFDGSFVFSTLYFSTAVFAA